MNEKERALRHYLDAYNSLAYQAVNQGLSNLLSAIGYAGSPPRCDFCGRPLAEGEAFRHGPCNTVRGMNFGGRL